MPAGTIDLTCPGCGRDTNIEIVSNFNSSEEKLNIFISNLSNKVEENDLLDMFKIYGNVDSTTIIKDKFSIKTMRFGFVKMPDDAEAMSAITGLHGKNINGRKLNVHQARIRPKERRREKRGGRRSTDQPKVKNKIK